MDYRKQFLELRKRYIEKRFGALNPEQRSAVLTCGGAALVLAGAGSGKTTVIINRIMCMLLFGTAYESDFICFEPDEEDVRQLKTCVEGDGIPDERLSQMLKAGNIRPWNIMAITFTNKAAGQLKERITRAVGEEGRDVFASTFHSACVRFLRRDGERLGWPKDFTIYDTADQEKVVKEICKSYGIDEKIYPVRMMLSRFGHIRDNLLTADEYQAQNPMDPYVGTICRVFREYQRRLREAGAFDFDDLIYYAVRLLQDNEDVREYYHRRFRYIMVDEYQDTSHAQFTLIKLLTNEDNNVFVVGDDDQSIYSFRGATIENILNFDRIFAPVKVIRLEQNYRSTSNILDCANAVIACNRGRKGKNLWTAGSRGAKVQVHAAESETDEASYIATDIYKHVKKGEPLSGHVVLYRVNAQSNPIENYFRRAGIRYKIVGGLSFYDRAEVKDALAYLQLVVNPGDDLRLKRIINVPARKIGSATVEKVEEIARGLGVPMMEVVARCRDYPALSRAANALEGFHHVYLRLCSLYEELPLGEFADRVLDETGLRGMYAVLGEEGEQRINNMNELVSNIRNYEAENPDGDLAACLEEMALFTTLDDYSEDEDCVSLMTIHTAKGLEFDYVYVIGMEEGLFPSDRTRFNENDLEEERRLAYVAMTRAKKELHLIRAEMRMLYGMTRRNPESRFLTELDESCVEQTGAQRRKPSSYLDRGYGSANRRAEGYAFGGGGAAPAPAAPKPKKKFAPAKTSYLPGDLVEHRMFGRGKVVSVTPVGGDVLVEIDFVRSGRKKTMANYAPMSKVEE